MIALLMTFHILWPHFVLTPQRVATQDEYNFHNTRSQYELVVVGIESL